jgi:hypothetical protein
MICAASGTCDWREYDAVEWLASYAAGGRHDGVTLLRQHEGMIFNRTEP